MLHIKRTDHVRNETILKTVDQQPLSDTVRERQLRRLGHVLRMKEDDISRIYALYGPNHGRRKRGRPRLLYHKYKAQTTGMTEAELVQAAQDRDGWRRLVVGCATQLTTSLLKLEATATRLSKEVSGAIPSLCRWQRHFVSSFFFLIPFCILHALHQSEQMNDKIECKCQPLTLFSGRH